jgi:hypothetical protein
LDPVPVCTQQIQLRELERLMNESHIARVDAFDHQSPLVGINHDIIRSHAGFLTETFNECRASSYKLADELQSQGFAAKVIRCTGLKTDAPAADQRWHDLGGQDHWVHFVVRCDEHIVDLTRRQFFPDSDNPFYQSIGAFEAEWNLLAPDDVKKSRFRS